MGQRAKSIAKYAIKILLSALALYIVSRKINFNEVWTLLKASNPVYLILAFALFNLSKIFSAFRLNCIFKSIQVVLSEFYNLKLYYIGMFYNLFLPGGIGGDGYKVFHLNKRTDQSSKKLVAAVLLDRVGGAAILLFLALALTLFIGEVYLLERIIPVLVSIAAVLAIPALYLLIKFVFPSFLSAFGKIVSWSLGVQIAQLICALLILWALGVRDQTLIYLVLFLLSSIAAMLPVSFGGFGLRELMFIYAAQIVPISETGSVALGMIFFTITVLSSLIGVFLKLPEAEFEQKPV